MKNSSSVSPHETVNERREVFIGKPARRELTPFVVAGILLVAIASTYFLAQLSRQDLLRLSSVAGPLTNKHKDAHAALARQVRSYEDAIVTEEPEEILTAQGDSKTCRKLLNEILESKSVDEELRMKVTQILQLHHSFTDQAEKLYTKMANGDESQETNLASIRLAADRRGLDDLFKDLDQTIAGHIRDGLDDVADLERITILVEIIIILGSGFGVFFFLRSVVAKPLERLVDERTQQVLEHERELVASENRFRQLIEHMSSGVIILGHSAKKDDFVFHDANRAVEVIEHVSRGELIGTSITAIFPAIRETKFYQALCEVNKTGESCRLDAHRYRDDRIDGWRQSFLYRLHTGEVVVVYNDITEKKMLDKQLETMNRDLQQASLQAGMAEIASGVLHNVGNTLNGVKVLAQTTLRRVDEMPMSGLKGIVELVDDHSNDLSAFIAGEGRVLPEYLTTFHAMMASEQQKLQKELGDLQRQVDHMGAVVQSQQTYAKQIAIEQRVSMKTIVEDALRLNHSSLARHDIEIKVDTDPGMEVVVQTHKVLQILVNLIQNAKEAMKSIVSDKKQLIITARVEDGDAVIRVDDNGVGISLDNREKLFSHGFTTRDEGHGFGLHSCALAAKQLGGTLTLESEGEGKGARFILRFPLVITEGEGSE